MKEVWSYIVEDKGCYCCLIVINIYWEAIEFYDCYFYEKGVCVYYMIKIELGVELFIKVIYKFV